MSGITYEMASEAFYGHDADLADDTTRARLFAYWVRLERELEAERRRQATEEAVAGLMTGQGPRSPTDASGPNLGSILGALAGVMAASQAPKPKDEDDGA